MAVDDLWYLSKRGPDGPDGEPGPRLASKQHGRGKRWRVRWVDDAGRDRRQLFERKADAERYDANVRADLSRGQYIDPVQGKTTVKAYGEAWRAGHLHAGNTADRIERTLRLHVYPYLGDMQLAQVRPTHIKNWVKDRSRVLAPSSMKVVYNVLFGLFQAAAQDRKIGVSPCSGDIKLPAVKAERHVIPTPEQVHGLAMALPEHLRALAYVAAGCGHRQGEAWGIELEHVDFLRREIQVVQQLCACAGREPHLAAPKTDTSVRTVEMGQVVAEALARHIELFPPEEVEILDETDPRKPVARKAKLLFVSARGKPMRRSGWSYPWAKAVKASGLPEGFGYHGLRHYFATLLIHAGASVKTVQLALGHSTPMITLNTYVHEWPEAVDRTRNLVDAALRQKPTLKVAR
ncbi:tyrosine-type recombinase/integrase [Micromonospora sp. NPDC049801]|uniref:tyrosine-type recombinase/integrase n=1 Tax=unclassified Micromonospora TaxID=2617518 RepID=UPI0033EB40FF